MAKTPRQASAPVPEREGIASAIERLCDELRVLRQSIDEIREDFCWVTRNGLPIQPIEHVVVHRMALDPCAQNWAEQLRLERFTAPADPSASPLNSEMLDRIADDIKTTLEGVAQGQLEVVLTALDGVRGEILSALKRRKQTGAADESPSAPVPAKVFDGPAEPLERPERGRLF